MATSQQPRAERVLLVEDEYMIAQDMAYELEELGTEVLGPVGSVAEALQLIEAEETIDMAFLDINLGGERVYAAADLLLARGVRVLFTTGYDESVIPSRYAVVPRYGKPVTRNMLRRALTGDR